jgi:pyruvate ferredoxin oxidoreductase alpha subunit
MKMICEASLAMAHGARLCRPKVVPMYPITPQTHIVERVADFINDGVLDAEMIHVESEHSACSALVGAVATGARTFTATSSQGLALMYEILPIVSGMRLPTVMAVANRALSAPINIWNDHSDAMSARDQGWLQLWVESSQEALDTVIQAYKIAENHDVLLPVMVNLDGFTLSHVWEPVDIPEQADVDAFLPEFKPLYRLDTEKPMTFGPIGFPDQFMEIKHAQQKAMDASLGLVKDTHKEFAKAFGRSYGDGIIEPYKMEDAEFAILGMGTLCGTAKVVADELREKGVKAGVLRLRTYRPFPKEELAKAVGNLKGLAVIDRHISVGYEGPLASEVKALFSEKELSIKASGYIAGLGGRDIKLEHLRRVYDDLAKGKEGGWLF